jgi:hypothetical protein
MRRSVWILVVCVLALGSAPQQKPKKKEKEPDPLPPLNVKVVEFARSHLGKPVGDGICVTLAVDALKEAGAKRFPFDRSGDYVWGEPVAEFKDVLPGDILQFRNAAFKGQKVLRGSKIFWHAEYDHHTAIVAKVEKNGKLITIYHQNIVTEGRPDSEKLNVKEGTLQMDSLQKGGWIKAYRPVPAERPASEPADDRGEK